ncbi:hypothetical protein ATCM_07235 [Stenotrophomonas sp. ATCM1_4]|uniref:hypothetical protein n=1 Tax=Stenotrophomonas sp. ATCM1_4 TaxID=2259330 RepID=UPI00104F7069|nr:hypothetical protein [Stenotrophomonas sp. ATCM1_4]TDB27470.1 hypothetical protein ATCM_07235 [Stenotrophomonas sp. ATCM1_4]
MSRPALSWWLLGSGAVLLLGGVLLQQLLAPLVNARAAGVLAGIGLGLLIAGVLRRLMPAGCDAATPTLRRRYTREVVVAMLGYVVLLCLSMYLLRGAEGAGLRALIALLPVPPIVLVLRAMVRYIRDVDEMQQRIELEAVSAATAFVSLVYLTGGFLQSAKVIDVPSNVAMIWVFPLVCLSYGLAKAVVARRYH